MYRVSFTDEEYQLLLQCVGEALGLVEAVGDDTLFHSVRQLNDKLHTHKHKKEVRQVGGKSKYVVSTLIPADTVSGRLLKAHKEELARRFNKKKKTFTVVVDNKSPKS